MLGRKYQFLSFISVLLLVLAALLSGCGGSYGAGPGENGTGAAGTMSAGTTKTGAAGGQDSNAGTASGNGAGDKILVVTSFYPVAEFVRQVGGERVQVQVLIADGTEPHDWEPTARDLGRIAKAKLFVYNGGVEPWAPKAIEAIGAGKVHALEAGQGLMELKGEQDPHVWLSPKLAAREVQAICGALSQVDPLGASLYAQNAQGYQAKLKALDQKLSQTAAQAKRKEFVTTHAAFGHLAEDYGLKQLAIMGLSPEAEPAPADLTRLVRLIEKKQIKYVFFETLVSPKVAQAIAEAAKVQTLVLDPLEGLTVEERQAGDDYVSVMERNIANLAQALE
jgi:zinc transport system substrate-binding protein